MATLTTSPKPPSTPPTPGEARRERLLSTGEWPSARESHSCVPVTLGASTSQLVYGGCAEIGMADDDAEGAPLGDAFLLDSSLRWQRLKPTGKAPPARGNHAAVAVAPNRMFVFGGKGAKGRARKLFQLL